MDHSAEVVDLRNCVNDLAQSQSDLARSQAETKAGVSSILGILQGQQAAQHAVQQQQPPPGGVNLAQPGFIPGVGVTPIVQPQVAAGYGGGLAGMPGFAARSAPARQPRAAAERMPPAGAGAGVAGPVPGDQARTSRRAGRGEGGDGGAGAVSRGAAAAVGVVQSGPRAAARGTAGGAAGAAGGRAGTRPQCLCGRDAKLNTVRTRVR